MSVLTSFTVSFTIIAIAETGDKSQLVCMSLASRYKPIPVLLGAVIAFFILNTMAVALGASMTIWVPVEVLKLIAAAIFIGFGIHTLISHEDEEEEGISAKKLANVFVTTFLMIFLAELGDKTQLAVATLSTSEQPVGVWAGSSFALFCTSALGIFLGVKFLNRLNPRYLSWGSGGLFIIFGTLLGLQTLMEVM